LDTSQITPFLLSALQVKITRGFVGSSTRSSIYICDAFPIELKFMASKPNRDQTAHLFKRTSILQFDKYNVLNKYSRILELRQTNKKKFY